MRKMSVAAVALLSFALLFSGGVGAQEVLHVAKVEKSKKSPANKIPRPARKHKPLASVNPTLPKGYRPPLLTSPRTRIAIAAYQECMYNNGDSPEELIHRALRMNLAYQNNPDLRAGSFHPEKIGLEVCLSDAIGLERYQTQAEIDAAKDRDLVQVTSLHVFLPESLPVERQYARPWVRAYVEELARDLNKSFAESGERLRVTSLVRSLAAQQQTGSPAKCRTVICSTHLTGSTVDISNSQAHVPADVREWIRRRLLKDRSEGKILVIEEFQKPHFHVFVIPPQYRSQE